MNKIVAVYGTLRKGYGNHAILAEGKCEFLGQDTISGYDMYTNGGFPMIVEGTRDIVIEKYRVTDETTMRRLDRLEGYNPESDKGMYLRRTIKDSEENDIDIYIWNLGISGYLHPIYNGDFKNPKYEQEEVHKVSSEDQD